jgi:hypothetical protein
VKVILSGEATKAFDGMPEGIDKAQIRWVLDRLGRGEELPESRDAEGAGKYVLAGTRQEWKVTYHIIELEEPIVSVVTIKKRRTIPWGLDFRPKRSDRNG